MDGVLGKLSQPRQLLGTLLEEPELMAIVRGIDAPTLGRLVRHVGLEDAGELVALATTEQLAGMFDEDLWKADAPGVNQDFDAQRFATWLEIMLEAGASFAARRLLALDEDLVMLALSQHLRAVDSDRVAAVVWKGTAPLDRRRLLQQALDSANYHEFEQYLVYSIHEPSWSTWLALLLVLDREHPERLSDWLERLALISFDERDVDDEGEFEDEDDVRVLRRSETLAADVAAERNERREREGYLTPSDALSFLRSARRSSLVEILGAATQDSITQAYFREWFAVPRPASAQDASQSGSSGEDSTTDVRPVRAGAEPQSQQAAGVADDAELSPAVTRWLAALREVETPQHVRRPLLASGEPTHELTVRAALQTLRYEDAGLYEGRVFELSYLANVLLAGASQQGRAFRPVEAAEAALALCNLGLERALGAAVLRRSKGERRLCASGWLHRHDLITAFRAGLHIAHHELALAASRALRSRLERSAGRLPGSARARQFATLAATLAKDAACDEPWRSAQCLDALEGVLVSATVLAFRALLEECPMLPPQMSGEEGPSGTAAPRFVSTATHVRVVAAALSRFAAGTAKPKLAAAQESS
jgi:hypothetical protein